MTQMRIFSMSKDQINRLDLNISLDMSPFYETQSKIIHMKNIKTTETCVI